MPASGSRSTGRWPRSRDAGASVSGPAPSMRATPVLVVSLLLTLLVAPLTAETQPGERVYRVGYLGAGQMGPPRLWREPTRPGPWRGLEGAQLFDALRAGLREHGYTGR